MSAVIEYDQLKRAVAKFQGMRSIQSEVGCMLIPTGSRRHNPRRGWWEQRHHDKATGARNYRAKRRYAVIAASSK